MLRLLNNQLPEYARFAHPAMRYVLGTSQEVSMRRRWVIQVFVGLLALVVLTVVMLTIQSANPLERSTSARLMAALAVLVVVAQVIVNLVALINGISVVAIEKRRQTWTDLRTTQNGIEITLRAHWIAMFYRLGGILMVLYVVRVVVIGAILYDLTAFSGEYLDYLTGGVVPDVPRWVGAPLLVLVMIGACLLPLASVSFDMALGILVSTFFSSRIFVGLAQFVLVIVRFMLPLFFVALINNPLNIDALTQFFAHIAFAGFADGGFRLLHLEYLGQIWGNYEYMIFIGAGMMVMAFALAAFAEVFLTLAVRRAQRLE